MPTTDRLAPFRLALAVCRLFKPAENNPPWFAIDPTSPPEDQGVSKAVPATEILLLEIIGGEKPTGSDEIKKVLGSLLRIRLALSGWIPAFTRLGPVDNKHIESLRYLAQLLLKEIEATAQLVAIQE